MSEKITIRLAESQDSPALVEFNQAMAHETEGKYLDREVLTNGVETVFKNSSCGFYVVAEHKEKIVGGLMVTFEWSDWRDAWFWWIQSVYILPAYRGKSIYTMLYDFVKQKASEEKNVCGFRLYVEHDNLHAQNVYEKVGMQKSHYLMFEESTQ